MKCSWIEPGILAASSTPITEDDIWSLHGEGIGAILSLTEHPLTRYRQITPALLGDLAIAYFHVPVPDQYAPTVGQAREILHIIAAMAAQQRPLLVHCQAGVGRTGTVLHLYYLGQGLSLEQAQAKIRVTRPACLLLSEVQMAFLETFSSQLGK